MTLSMFSALPAPNLWDEKSMNLVLPLLPVLGGVLGLIFFVLTEIINLFSLNTMAVSAILTVLYFGLTGFIHLDGYMDVSDAILSRRNFEERLRILKDPHSGAYSVIMVIFLILGMFSCFNGIIEAKKHFIEIIFIMISSRGMSALSLMSFRLISKSGLGHMFKEKSKNAHLIFIILFLLAASFSCFWFLGIKEVIIFFATGIVSLIATLICRKSFGGVSGDTSGFSIVLSEMAGVLLMII